MMFETWWATLPIREQSSLGINNARYVWGEATKYSPNVLFIDGYTLSRSGDRVIIMADDGEGGTFDLKEFSEVVGKFFADKF